MPVELNEFQRLDFRWFRKRRGNRLVDITLGAGFGFTIGWIFNAATVKGAVDGLIIGGPYGAIAGAVAGGILARKANQLLKARKERDAQYSLTPDEHAELTRLEELLLQDDV